MDGLKQSQSLKYTEEKIRDQTKSPIKEYQMTRAALLQLVEDLMKRRGFSHIRVEKGDFSLVLGKG